MGIEAAIIGGAVLGAGATVYSSNKASSAANTATDAATAANLAAIETEWKMYQQQRKDFAPWRKAGEKALGQLVQMVEKGPGEFVPEEQPGYEFGFKNFIEKPYLSAQSAKGKRLSGETTKALIGYAQDYASTSYDNFLSRYYQKLQPYQSLAGVGQTAASGSSSAAGQYGATVAGLQTNMGNLQYQNALQQGNIQTGMSAGIAGIGQQAGQNYMNYLMLNKLGAA